MARKKTKTTAGRKARRAKTAATAAPVTASPATGFQKPALQIVAITYGANHLFGVGNDNAVYLWDAFSGKWKLNTMDDAQRKALLAAAIGKSNGAEETKPATGPVAPSVEANPALQ